MRLEDDITNKRIQETIKRAGWHISLVTGGPVPPSAHTIGLVDHRGYELLWAGGLFFARDQIQKILNTAAILVLEADEFEFRGERFRVAAVHESWAHLLARQAYVFLGASHLDFRQVMPLSHRTLDVPDLSRPYAEDDAGAWRWLTRGWPFAFPRGAQVSTDLHVLSGEPVVEFERWDDALYAAHGRRPYADADLRLAPLGTILAQDPSCEAMGLLRPGTYASRPEAGAAWADPIDALDKPLSRG